MIPQPHWAETLYDVAPAKGQYVYNKKSRSFDYWKMQEAGTIPLPDFIGLSAEGKAKMKDGHVYLKRDS